MLPSSDASDGGYVATSKPPCKSWFILARKSQVKDDCERCQSKESKNASNEVHQLVRGADSLSFGTQKLWFQHS